MSKTIALSQNDEEHIEAECRRWHHGQANGGGFVWFLGVLGAAVYYIQAATTFWAGALGLLKAFIWPAFLVYELLRYVGT